MKLQFLRQYILSFSPQLFNINRILVVYGLHLRFIDEENSLLLNKQSTVRSNFSFSTFKPAAGKMKYCYCIKTLEIALFQHGCFSHEMTLLVISNETLAVRWLKFKIMHIISDQFTLHSFN